MSHLFGQHLTELDTPALCIDLNLMEENMQTMTGELSRSGKNWRPHIKCHKVPEIARQQIAAGAIGITSAKSSEAEVFIQSGIEDVLIANLVVGEQKLERVVRMCQSGNPIVTCDHFVQAEALSDICRQKNVRCRVIIEVDLGMERVGVRPGPDALALAQGISKLPHLDLVGIMGYEGHLLTIPDQEKKQQLIFSAMSILEELKAGMDRSGLNCEIVSAGGTGSYQITAQHPVVTELQAGGGIFADPFYLEKCQVTGLHSSLFLLATVVSRPRLERAVLDLGRKSLHPDIYAPQFIGMANGKQMDDAQIDSLSAEHLTLKLSGESLNLIVGDKVLIRPGYCDHTNVLHTHFIGLRDGIVEAVWPLAARGMLQ